MEKFQGYTYDDAIRIINYYANRLRGIGNIATYATLNRSLVSGQAQEFFPLPFNPENESYELFLFSYQTAPVKSDWLQARNREQHRWLPFVVIGGQPVPLVPVVAEMHIWDEGWRNQ